MEKSNRSIRRGAERTNST
ncbi:MAG: hypothetical protein ACIPMY_05885 [Rickettsia endosymbiont of Pentastiridius leporinus]